MLATIEASTYVFTALTEGYFISEAPSKTTSKVLLIKLSLVFNEVVTLALFAFNAN